MAFQPQTAAGLQGGVAVPSDSGLSVFVIAGCGLVMGGVSLFLGLIGLAAERDRAERRRRKP